MSSQNSFFRIFNRVGTVVLVALIHYGPKQQIFINETIFQFHPYHRIGLFIGAIVTADGYI